MATDLTPQVPADGEPVVTDPVVTDPVKDPVDGVVADATDPVVTPDPDKADGKADAKEDGAPETYADFTFPEGIEVDKVAMEAFAPIAKELNLTQEQAQSLVDIQANQIKLATEAQQTAWDTTIEGWVETARSDKEIGGDNFDAKLATAKIGIEKFGTKELLEIFDATGVGNNPEVIRVFYRIGKLVENDKFVFGKSDAPTQQKTAAEILFPNMA